MEVLDLCLKSILQKIKAWNLQLNKLTTLLDVKSPILLNWDISKELFKYVTLILINLLLIFEIYRASFDGYFWVYTQPFATYKMKAKHLINDLGYLLIHYFISRSFSGLFEIILERTRSRGKAVIDMLSNSQHQARKQRRETKYQLGEKR